MSQSSLLRHFPPPRFLNPERVGISFSDRFIKAVLFGREGNRFPVKSLIVPLENGTIVAGIVTKPEDLVKKIVEVKKELKSSFAFITIPDELTYLFTTSIPVKGRSNPEESVAFIIEENVPLDLRDTVFDFTPISIQKGVEDYESKVVVAACLEREVKKYIDAVVAAEIQPIGCVHESQAIARSLIPVNVEKPVCIAHTREDRIGIYLAKKSIVQFSTLRTAANSNYGGDFLDEYMKFLEYWDRHEEKKEPIESIFVCGEFEFAKQAVSAILNSDKINEKALLGNVWVNVFSVSEHLPDMPYEKSLGFAGAIGAALMNI